MIDPEYTAEPLRRRIRELEARLQVLEAENNFVREKINAYVKSGFDPSMMGATLDDIRHQLKVNDLKG